MRKLYILDDILANFRRADISVFHDFVPSPAGGGHQFMRALQQGFENEKYIVENNTISPTTKACIFNSFNFNFKRLKAKKQTRNACKMIHRVDGPMSLYRGIDDGTDNIIHAWNAELADLTIFQSRYSLEAHKELGYSFNKPHFIIPNTPDPIIFKPDERHFFSANRKVRLISTSWSDNPNKGLNTYKWLDQNLDWNRYEYCFIGRIQAKFKNIKHIEPVESAIIAEHLRDSDIYITASRHDPCSNSLLEALACDLPALYLNSGGHRELVQQAGLPFNDHKQIPELLNQLVDSYENYKGVIMVPTIYDITRQYLTVMELK